MGKIAVLDKNMINMIAAGEVIERPASVVKEMLENSLDAGATKVVVRIEDGGKKLISITDNGCGMIAEDLPTAFEPHATSKIKNIDDLNEIKSMGFRGEALASIGSVAKIKVVSKTADSIEAYSFEIDCGEKSSVMPASGDYGTTIEVRDLFYKLPARRKFLRTTNTEISHITEHFTRIALAHCDVDMTLIHNNRQLYRLHGKDDIIHRISELMNKQIANDLMTVDSEERGIRIRAYIGRPTSAKSNNKFQYIFLNGRFIRDKFILHAIKEAYRGLIEPNKHPLAFLFIEMPYDSYDVNVHPTKVEVRFDQPNLVHSVVLGVLREKLLGMDLDVRANMNSSNSTREVEAVSLSEAITNDEESRRSRIREAMSDFFDNNTKTQKQHNFKFSGSTQTTSRSGGFSGAGKSFGEPASHKRDFEYISPRRAGSFENDILEKQSHGIEDRSSESKKIIQLHNTYIIEENEEGFAIIDQHALHERIIYEKLKAKIVDSENGLESQKLLIPETIDVTPVQEDIINEHSELFKKLGIEIESFGPGTYAIHSFPTLLKNTKPADFVSEMLDIVSETGVAPDTEKLIHAVLDMTSCKAAIKAGQPLSEAEMRELIGQKGNIDCSSRCPHGRPTIIKFTISDLEKMFKRTGF